MGARHKDFDRYVAACDFPGVLDEDAVTAHLQAYLRALGVERDVKRLPPGWRVEDDPALQRYADRVLDEFKKHRAARAARDARDARDAKQCLVAWCIQAYGWAWYRWDLALWATTHLGATSKPKVDEWAAPLFEAYVAGAWMLHWTEDTLFWVAKPRVHVEHVEGRGRRLHRSDGPAVTSDVEPIYFDHGVLMPSDIYEKPGALNAKRIDSERNAEVRRAMISLYGQQRYMEETQAKVIHEDDDPHWAKHGRVEKRRLLRRDLVGDPEPIVMVNVPNSSLEPDGSLRRYMIRVDPRFYGGRAGRECHAAIASTFRKKRDRRLPAFATPESYAPEVES